MKTFTKRFFSLILMCLMVCTIFPTAAFAAEATCHFCGVTCSYTVDYEQWTDNIHCVRHWCSNCGYDMLGGVLGEDHTMVNGICTLCGYDDGTGDTEDPEPDPEPEVCYHDDTYTTWDGCDWTEYCSDCGEYMDSGTSHGSTYTEWDGCDWYEYCRDCDELMDSGTSHGSYSYSSWEYYSTSRHRRYYSCDDCGEGSYTYGSHSTTTEYTSYSSSQHTVGSYCSTCKSYVGSTSYENHTISYGSWVKYSDSQHRRSVFCSDCGYSGYEYEIHSHTTETGMIPKDDEQHNLLYSCDCGHIAEEPQDHIFTYTAWTESSESEHQREVTCDCGYESIETAPHRDSDNDGYREDCGYLTSRFSVTVPVYLLLTVSEYGIVYAADDAEIINNSTGTIAVTEISIVSSDGWTLVPYTTDMADEKVNSRLIGFTINGTDGFDCTLAQDGRWTAEPDSVIPLTYDANVSATSEAITGEQVLTVVFVVDWVR